MAETKKTAKKMPKLSDAEQVAEYMAKLDSPLKSEVEALRSIIINAGDKLKERIKWNAPSYYLNNYDMAAFQLRPRDYVHIVFVFHNGNMVENEGLLEGDYKDRRMARFYSMDDVNAKKAALEKVVREWIALHE